jgi:hypothetical protein
LAPPLADGLTPATNTTAPIRHRLPDFFKELAERGLVERAPDPEYRRRNVITITAQGRRHLRYASAARPRPLSAEDCGENCINRVMTHSVISL